MMRDSDKLFRAMGEIDDKYVVEILDEDKNRSPKAVKKNSKGTVIRFMRYAVPAAAALLIVFAVSRMGNMSSGTQMADSSAPAATMSEEACMTDSEASTGAAYKDSDEAAYYTAEMENAVPSTSSEAASVNADEAAGEPSEREQVDTLQIPNPFVECADPDEAAGVAGFEFTVPDDLFSGSGRKINAIENKMIQVIYFDGDEYDPDKEILRIRKAAGSSDISGDTSKYAYEESGEIAGCEVVVKGADADKISVATWESKGYSYAVLAGNETIDFEVLETIVSSVTE